MEEFAHATVFCAQSVGFAHCVIGLWAVTVRPAVSTSRGYPVFKAMGEIRRYPLHVGLFIDPKLEEENNEDKNFWCCSRRFAFGS